MWSGRFGGDSRLGLRQNADCKKSDGKSPSMVEQDARPGSLVGFHHTDLIGASVNLAARSKAVARVAPCPQSTGENMRWRSKSPELGVKECMAMLRQNSWPDTSLHGKTGSLSVAD